MDADISFPHRIARSRAMVRLITPSIFSVDLPLSALIESILSVSRSTKLVISELGGS
nr:MAG TPA: hypothetical protein [Caudoviricetes sp.]